MMSVVDCDAVFKKIEKWADECEAEVIAWQRDIHQHPELGNREFRTASIVARHLRSLGLEVVENVAHTGVVGLLKGARSGPVVALRADMDALPITEENEFAYASKVRDVWEGSECGVMHACGHDGHTAILMGVAKVLTRMRAQITGDVKFIFQPAEEGPPEDEEGGAQLMIKEGVLKNPRVDAILGLHLTSRFNSGIIGYRSGPLMAGIDTVNITVEGSQTHGGMPWRGVDPIVLSAQILMGLQTIISRQTDLTKDPAVITIGSIHGGNRSNIIPERVTMLGTVRTFNEAMRSDLLKRLSATCRLIAQSAGGRASVKIHKCYAVTFNDESLTRMSIPVLEGVAGQENARVVQKGSGSEDFSFYQQKIPGFFFFLGCTPATQNADTAPPNHSPRFSVDESVLKIGVRALSSLAFTYLGSHARVLPELEVELDRNL